jgi:hypothetical protein
VRGLLGGFPGLGLILGVDVGIKGWGRGGGGKG